MLCRADDFFNYINEQVQLYLIRADVFYYTNNLIQFCLIRADVF